MWLLLVSTKHLARNLATYIVETCYKGQFHFTHGACHMRLSHVHPKPLFWERLSSNASKRGQMRLNVTRTHLSMRDRKVGICQREIDKWVLLETCINERPESVGCFEPRPWPNLDGQNRKTFKMLALAKSRRSKQENLQNSFLEIKSS